MPRPGVRCPEREHGVPDAGLGEYRVAGQEELVRGRLVAGEDGERLVKSAGSLLAAVAVGVVLGVAHVRGDQLGLGDGQGPFGLEDNLVLLPRHR
ncbi:MAG: hypothetical protein ABSB76_17535 [Streptosporangiaceae bacterium]